MHRNTCGSFFAGSRFWLVFAIEKRRTRDRYASESLPIALRPRSERLPVSETSAPTDAAFEVPPVHLFRDMGIADQPFPSFQRGTRRGFLVSPEPSAEACAEQTV